MTNAKLLLEFLIKFDQIFTWIIRLSNSIEIQTSFPITTAKGQLQLFEKLVD
jgi:hypothetical protein